MGEANAIAMSTRSASSEPSVVKSAGRVLRILEYFDSVRREACVSEISRTMKWTQSSTSVLLKSLVSLGYLQHDRFRRTYRQIGRESCRERGCHFVLFTAVPVSLNNTNNIVVTINHNYI